MNGTDISALFDLLCNGDRGALARAITLVESTKRSDKVAAQTLLDRAVSMAAGSLRVGITGIPGVGKSTLIEALGMHLIEAGHRVAVLAIDPSSTKNGGSILGDKTRMERLSQQDAAFIRPTPTSGALGGVARRTRETIALCETAGFDRILIETVGVGQSELDVERMTDLNVLLMIAGAGDELQGIKRGIMETADVIAITKAELDAHRAQNARQDLRNAIHYLPTRANGKHPEVLLTDALSETGIEKLMVHIHALFAELSTTGALNAARQLQDQHWLTQAVEFALLERFKNDPTAQAALEKAKKAVAERKQSPFHAAEEVVDGTFGQSL